MNHEEKTTLIADNQTMALQMQDLNLQVEKLRDELQLFNLAKDNLVPDDPAQGAFLNTQRLATRVSELEDLVQEFKNQHAPQDVLDLKEIIARQSSQIAQQKTRVAELTVQRHRAVDLFEKNELYATY